MLTWLAVLGLAVLAWRTVNRSRAGIWFLGGLILLLPSSSIFPANDLAADYRMYLPMIGFAGSIGLLLERVSTAVSRAGVAVADRSQFLSHADLAARRIAVGRRGRESAGQSTAANPACAGRGTPARGRDSGAGPAHRAGGSTDSLPKKAGSIWGSGGRRKRWWNSGARWRLPPEARRH